MLSGNPLPLFCLVAFHDMHEKGECAYTRGNPTYVHLLVVANGSDGGRLPQSLPSLLERNDRFRSVDELVHGAVELRQLLANVLHLPQELFAVVQAEVRDGVRGVQALVLSEKQNSLLLKEVWKRLDRKHKR